MMLASPEAKLPWYRVRPARAMCLCCLNSVRVGYRTNDVLVFHLNEFVVLSLTELRILESKDGDRFAGAAL
jgi:hypothetical protein